MKNWKLKMDIWYMKIEGYKVKHLEIWLRTVEWDNRTKSQNRGKWHLYYCYYTANFKANNPASQLESRHTKKKNGGYFLWKLQNIAHIMSLPNVSLAHHISKVCLTNATTKKLQENKVKLHKNLKSMKLLKNCTKETSVLPETQKPRF